MVLLPVGSVAVVVSGLHGPVSVAVSVSEILMWTLPSQRKSHGAPPI